MRRLLMAVVLLATGMVCAQQKTTIQLPPQPLLPMSFAGWAAEAKPVESMVPPAADAAILKELGFRRAESATYKQGSSTLNLTAYQFRDATSAYCYLSGHDESDPLIEVGSQERRAGTSAVIRRGDTVVVGTFTPTTAQHPKEDLNELARTLPIPTGSNGLLPSLPRYLPQFGLDAQSLYYAIGPVGFANFHNLLIGLIDFNTGAEAVVGHYGSGMLTLVEYPTPQMAAAQLRSIADALHLSVQKDGLLTGDKMAAIRTGPIIALASDLPEPQAVKLANSVHYESELTWNHPEGYVSEAWKAAHLYLGIAALSGVLIAAAILLGLFLGGGRALYRVLRGKPASAAGEVEFLHLDLGHGGDYLPKQPEAKAETSGETRQK